MQRLDPVYAYCDRWCERCPHTAECSLFPALVLPDRFVREEGRLVFRTPGFERLKRRLEARRKEPCRPDSAGGPKMKPAEIVAAEIKELRPPESVFGDSAEMIRRIDEELQTIPLMLAATEYRHRSRLWLALFAAAVEVDADDSLHADVAKALDVLGWDHALIERQLNRALSGRIIGREEHDLPAGSEPEHCDDPCEPDFPGTARVALLSVERSMGAWGVVIDAAPHHRCDVSSLQKRLGWIRREIDVEFPLARTFRRPLLDS